MSIINNKNGFSLIEVLASLGIGALLLAFIMSVIEYQNKGSQAITQNFDFKLAKIAIQNSLSQPDMCKANFSKHNYFKHDNGGILQGTYNANGDLTDVTIDGKGRTENIIKPTEETVVFPLGISTSPVNGKPMNPNDILLVSAEVSGGPAKDKTIEVLPTSVYLHAPSKFKGTQISIFGMRLGGENNFKPLSQDGKTVEIDLILNLKRETPALAPDFKDEIIKIIANLDDNNEIMSCYAQSISTGGGTGSNMFGFWNEYKIGSKIEGIYYHKNSNNGHQSGNGFVGIGTQKPESILHVQSDNNTTGGALRISTKNNNKALTALEASMGYYNNKGTWVSGVDNDGNYFVKTQGIPEQLILGSKETGTLTLGNEIKIGNTKDPLQECTAEHGGKIKYSKDENKFYFCDGKKWEDNEVDTSSIIGDFNGSEKMGNVINDGDNQFALICPAGSAVVGVKIRQGTDIVLGSGQAIFTSVRGLQLNCQKLDPKTHAPIGKIHKTILAGEKSGLNKLYDESSCPAGQVAVSLKVNSHTGGTARVHGLQLGCINPQTNRIHRLRTLAGEARKHVFPDIARFLGIPSGKTESYTCDKNSYLRELRFTTQGSSALGDMVGFASMFNIEAECW